ncbi:MAG: hypothetical protein AAF420_02305, partial [Pseudomonadota bacterium]
ENPVNDITHLLSDQDVDIRNINFQQFGSDAILNLVTVEFELALRLLNSNGYTTLTEDTLLIKVEDKLGVLAEISQRIADAGVHIRSLALLKISDEDNVVTISTNDNSKVRELYREHLVN